jgi:S1-C subfamily serine protease
MRRSILVAFLAAGTILSSLHPGSTAGTSSEAQFDPAVVYERTADSVVLLVVKRLGGDASLGTGFVVRADGVIATALHVVENAKTITVKLRSGELYDVAYIYNFDRRKDLALLKILATDLHPIELGDLAQVRVGDRVMSISNPAALGGVLEHSFSEGNVSSVRLEERLGAKVIQTTAAVSSGSSGGPLLSTSGQAIGLISFKATGGESLNFCIPTNYVSGLLQQDRHLELAEFAAAGQSVSSDSASNIEAILHSSIDGMWRELTEGESYLMREVEGTLYIEQGSSPGPDGGLRRSGRLQKAGEGWEGEITIEFTCQYVGGFVNPETRTNYCRIPLMMKLTSVAGDKISGFAQRFRPGASFSSRDCGNCFPDLPVHWSEIVMVRSN